MYTDEEQDPDWLRANWLPELSEDELMERISKLPSYDKTVVLGELHVNSLSPGVTRRFSELAEAIMATYSGPVAQTVAIKPRGEYGLVIQRPSTRQELLDKVVGHENVRRWSANNNERKELDKLAEQEAARRLQDTAAGRDTFGGLPDEDGVYIEVNPGRTSPEAESDPGWPPQDS